MRLGRIFYDCNIKAVGSLTDCGHAGDVVEKVDDDDSCGPRACRGIDVIEGEQQSLGINVDEHRPCTGCHHSARGGNERIGWHDDLVAAADASGGERQLQSVCAVGNTDGVGGAAVFGPPLFERFYSVAADETGRIKRLAPRRVEAGPPLCVVGCEIDERDLHRSASTRDSTPIRTRAWSRAAVSAASRPRTTASPECALVSGVSPVLTQCKKCSSSSASGSLGAM